MKFLVLLISMSIILISCDPVYSVLLKNNTRNSLIVKSNPAIESLHPKEGAMYRLISSLKIGSEDTIHIYRIMPGDSLSIFGGLGNHPTLSSVPFSYLQIISRNDTTTLHGKKEIYSFLKKDSTTAYYYLRMK